MRLLIFAYTYWDEGGAGVAGPTRPGRPRLVRLQLRQGDQAEVEQVLVGHVAAHAVCDYAVHDGGQVACVAGVDGAGRPEVAETADVSGVGGEGTGTGGVR